MNNMRWNAKARLAGVLAGVLSVTVGATSMLGVDLDQLSRQSEVVVRGVVRSKESRWSSDGRRILTDVRIEVSESLKGSPARTVTVQQPGGVVGEIGQKVAGLASFETGEEVVVFLSRWGAQRYQVTAAAQGKFRVERSSDGKRAFAVPDPAADAELIDPATGQPMKSKLETLELSEFRERVKKAAAPRSAQ